MPASTLPTRSEPTSAALVKMPPPTRANSAMELAPNPKPATTLMFWNIRYRMVTPSSPMPTTEMPITVPLEKATRSAGFSPRIPAAAVRTLARTATFIPMNPAVPEQMVPTKYEMAVAGTAISCLKTV